jgi:cytochrome c-type biogenesis protein CcmF
VAVVGATPLLLLTDVGQSGPALAVVVAGVFVAACIGGELWRGLRVRHALGGVSWPGAFLSMIGRNRRRYGGYGVHLGIVVLFIGLAGSRGFATERSIALPEGGRAQVAGYTFLNEGSVRSADAHKMSVQVRLGVFQGGQRVATLRPGTDLFRSDGTRASKVAIDSGPARDLYVVLTRLSEDGAATVTVFVNPLVLWLWVAGALVGLGGLLAAWPGPPSSRRERARSPAAPGQARA